MNRRDRETARDREEGDREADWGDFGYGRGGYTGPSQGHGYEYSDQSYARERQGYGSAPVWTAGEPWQTPGPHTGRGPKGYRRSDERICDEICDRLMRSGEIDASDIEVTVDNGEVSLSGWVDSRPVKRMAEDIAESVIGVNDVFNRLKIGRPPQGREPFAAVTDARQLRVGMLVASAEGDELGTVKEVRASDFLLNRPMSRDVFVPFEAIQSVQGERISLKVPIDDVDKMNWAKPYVGEPSV